jgi:DNA-binding cell septation regulator SpoVG
MCIPYLFSLHVNVNGEFRDIMNEMRQSAFNEIRMSVCAKWIRESKKRK